MESENESDSDFRNCKILTIQKKKLPKKCHYLLHLT